MVDLAVQIGQKIRSAREAEGLTQAQLAHRIGVTVMTISRWERGVNRPSLEGINRVAIALRVSLASLLPGNGDVLPDAEMVA